MLNHSKDISIETKSQNDTGRLSVYTEKIIRTKFFYSRQVRIKASQLYHNSILANLIL